VTTVSVFPDEGLMEIEREGCGGGGGSGGGSAVVGFLPQDSPVSTRRHINIIKEGLK